MKKLIVLASFFALFLLITGCQSETSVDPLSEQETTVEKPEELWMTVGAYDYPSQIQVHWGGAGNHAKEYHVYYTDDPPAQNPIIEGGFVQNIRGTVEYGKQFYGVNNGGVPVGSYIVTVEVIDKKGNIIKSLSKNYTVSY